MSMCANVMALNMHYYNNPPYLPQLLPIEGDSNSYIDAIKELNNAVFQAMGINKSLMDMEYESYSSRVASEMFSKLISDMIGVKK